ncbi:MAG: replication terminator protein [Candidatus Omnitrophica bacterium]|nr:replication terminator protein [Candidatus Omnitrophota bacterium]
MNKTEIVSLETLKEGAVSERFNIALQEVLDNILDPNTEPVKARSINLKFSFKPNQDRDFCAVSISSDVKLAPISSLGTEFFIGKQDGKLVACERSLRQTNLLADTPLPDNVKPIKPKEAANQ